MKSEANRTLLRVKKTNWFIQLGESCKKWKTLVLLGAMLLINANTMWGTDLYVRGDRNSWGTSDKMTGTSTPWTHSAYWSSSSDFKISTSDWSKPNLGGNGSKLSLSWNTKSSALLNDGGSKNIAFPALGTGGGVVKLTVTLESSKYYIKAEKLLEEQSSWVDIVAPKIYFDNTDAAYSNVSVLYGRYTNYGAQGVGSGAQSLSRITNTNLYYTASISNTSGDASKFTTLLFINGSWSGWEGSRASERAALYATSYTTSNAASLNSSTYLFSAASGNKGATLSHSQLSGGYTDLNHSQTVYKYTSSGGTTPGSYTAQSVNSGTVTISAYKLTAASTASNTGNSATINTASTTSASKDAVFTGAVTLTAEANAGYTFVGWFASTSATTALSTESSYTYNAPNSAYSVYARFLAEETHDVTVYYKYGSTTVKTATTETAVGVTTARSFTAPSIDGYNFFSYTFGSGLTMKSANTTTNPCSFITKASGTYELTVNYNIAPVNMYYGSTSTFSNSSYSAMTYDASAKAYYVDVTTNSSPYYFRFNFNTNTQEYAADWNTYPDVVEATVNGEKVACDQTVKNWDNKSSVKFTGDNGSSIRIWFSYKDKKAWITETTYTITVANDGHGTTSTASVTAGRNTLSSSVTATPNSGYSFSNWTRSTSNITITSSTSTSTTVKATSAGTITANFTANNYTITLHEQGATTHGSPSDGGTITATYDANTNLTGAITTPEKTGYTFDGYYPTAACDGTWIIKDDGYFNWDGTYLNSSTGVWKYAGNVDLYAKWVANNYTITLDVDEDHKGTIAGATTSQTIYYNDATVTVPNRPTGATGYGLAGYYTEHNGGGVKLINGDGTWIASVTGYTDANKKWIHADDVTLYAYYKQAEVARIDFDEAIVETNATVTATPTIDPIPAGSYVVCWRVLYSNGNPLASQPTFTPGVGNSVSFTAPDRSGSYKLEATLRSSSSCGSGDVLHIKTETFQVASEHDVTVLYKCGDMTIKASETLEGIKPLEWSDGITAPSITGYTFSNWEAGDGVTIKDGESSTATTHIKATYDGTLTANYTRKRMIYFYNTLNWSNVYVYFYKNDSYWDGDKGTGANTAYVYTSTPYSAGKHGQMQPIETGSKIYYFDAEGASVDASYTCVAFTEHNQHGYNFFYETNAVKRGDYASTTMPMFVPLADQTPTKKNNNKTNYYFNGYWMNYPANTGYTLNIYDWYENAEPSRTYQFPYSGDLKMPLKLDVDFTNGEDFWISVYRNDEVMLGKNYEIKQDYNDPQTITSTNDKLKVITSVPGIYSFTLGYTNTDYYIDVDYPASVGDYRILYKDNATWAMGAHDGSWEIASDVINKNSGSEAKSDTVSFFVSKGAGITVTMKFQKISSIDGSSGAVTWADVSGGSITIPSSVTKAGVYNFIVTQPAGGSSISLTKVEPYSGNYYIRTDCAGNTKWNNYKAADHLMTYSDYAEKNSGFSHYFAHWVTSGTNVKFCIANDYSMCLTEHLGADYGTAIATIDGDGNLTSGDANIRFMWNQSTNKINRAYISGSGTITDRFLVLEGDSKMYDENGHSLTGDYQDHDQYGTKLGADNQVIMHDDENFVYERTIQLNTTARGRLSAKYNNNTQYFIGSSGAFAEGTTVELLGGAASVTKYSMRIVYDFKTNRLVKAYIPSGSDITEDLAINADIMLVREHQEAGQQLTFDGGSLSKVKTVYGVMRLNRWTLNNREKTGGHSLVGDPKSIYERSLYWISFPFDVNLSDVFGFGTYGTHWVIEEYDGAERAAQGYWADSNGFWKIIWSRSNKVLEAGKGYVLAIDLDLMKYNNTDFWSNNIEQVELFFPSASEVENIKETDTEITVPSHECTIDRRTDKTTPDTDKDRTTVDSHWNMIGIPSYANYGSTLKDGSNTTITWKDPETQDLPYLYEWNAEDDSYTPQSGTTYPFKSMHSYMVQYHGKIKWLLASATPAAPARRALAGTEQQVELRLEIQQNSKMTDQTFVRLSNDEQVSAEFAFDEDMTKEFNKGKANIYTIISNYLPAAGNTLPMSEQSTVVPVGVKITTDGDYTFSIPDGTEGVGVTLLDTETGIRTSLSALDYTVSLEAGTYNDRFLLEISPIQHVATALEPSAVGDQQSDVRKILIDGLLYIVRDGKMFDARGARVE